MAKLTDYNTAAHWGNCSLILCNNIATLDQSIYDNARFNFYDEENETEVEIFQYFLTNLNEWEVEWQEENFPELKYTYSDMLECYVLCVDHFGTMWNSVTTEVNEELLTHNPDIEYKGI